MGHDLGDSRAGFTNTHPLYVGVIGRGLFEIRLDHAVLEPLAIHHGAFFDFFTLSPDRKRIVYGLHARPQDTIWTYEIATGVEHSFADFPQYGSPQISPDSVWLASFSHPPGFGDTEVAFLNLLTGTVKIVTIGNELGNTMNVGSFHWSAKGHQLLFNSGKGPVKQKWKVVPSAPDPILITDTQASLLDADRDLLSSFHWSNGSGPVSVGSGTVSRSDDRLIRHMPGMPDKILARTPQRPPHRPGQANLECGPSGLEFLGVMDQAYVLYKLDDALRVYGINENRTVSLPSGEGWPVAWK